MSLTLAIVGRPNVGKSTLFNRLIGKRHALVDNRPGVTRDFREGSAKIGSRPVTFFDTAGFETKTGPGLGEQILAMTERAIDLADASLFLVDARSGVLPADFEIAELLRRRGKPTIVVANKSEGRAGSQGYLEAFEFGFGEPVRLSAEHGEGIDDLFRAILPLIEISDSTDGLPEKAGCTGPEQELHGSEGESLKSGPLQIAVVGRPNSGKSSLINRILGQERLLTGETPGITRDSISVTTDWNGTSVRIFDTAGMRKRAKVVDRIEKLSVADGLNAVQFAEVVVVLLDAQIPFESQDLRIADLAERNGRAVVIALNKWDLIRNRTATYGRLRLDFSESLPKLRGAPLTAVSALTGFGMDRLRVDILSAWNIWNLRVSTGPLNRWLEDMVQAHPPPAPGGRRIRLRFATQIKARPPSFVVMCSQPQKLPESYTRYLVNGLRDEFGFAGTPIRISLRSSSGENPYD